jgi:hypothetical protein
VGLDAQEEHDFNSAVIAGWKLSAKSASELEAALVVDPYDLVARAKLVGAFKQIGLPRAAEHIHWLITYAPERRVAVAILSTVIREASTLARGALDSWARVLAAMVPDDPRRGAALLNAAQFAGHFDTALHRRWREEARAAVKSPVERDVLDQLEINDLVHHADAPAATRLARVEELVERRHDRGHNLHALAELAFEAGAHDKAAAYAQELLRWSTTPRSSWPGIEHAPFHAHTILGRVALRRGDAGQAAEHLRRSARIKARPPFTFAGPPMRFAKEMLEHGEREAVLDFFAACAKFWQKQDVLEKWIDDVHAGRMPDFGWRAREGR